MIGTYAAALAVCAVSLVLGQAAIGLCGARRWSWLAPPVGLALLCATCWATVRMPGEGTVSAIAVLALTVAAAAYLRGRVEGGREALRAGVPVALVALAAASLPFVVEGHFGILGTGFNPDMSQHLLATDRLAHGEGSQLLNQGYPLGPHSIVVALSKGLGIGLVQGFSGLTMAVALLAPLTALAAFGEWSRIRRTAAALVVGLPYLVASYYAQGSFKETTQALFVLAFVLALRESGHIRWRASPLRLVPAALVAVGSIYTYSFAGLVWLAPVAVIWVVLERISAGGMGGGGVEDGPWPARSAPPPPMTGPAAESLGPSPFRAMLLALAVFAIGALPELGRMIDFQSFETFDPSGPGLGNLFGQVSPFAALGIWPSGDFRVAAGDGAAPALVYYLGAAFATVLLALGVRRAWRGGERTVLAGLAAVAAVYLASRASGTAYTSAKALEIAAPLLTLTILLPLSRQRRSSAGGAAGGDPHGGGRRAAASEHMGVPAATGPAAAAYVYLAVAGACSLLALANAPVGPTSYSPALTGLRPLLSTGSTLVLAPQALLDDEQGERYLVWELRGGRVCIAPEDTAGGPAPPGVRFVVTTGAPAAPPFERLALRRRAGPYAVWERRGVVGGPSPCPLIAVRQARHGP